MNLAAAAPEQQSESTVSQTVPVAILGTDALLAAAPYTAVQLAHACLQAGYASVVPASWGDELVAAAVLRRLPKFGQGPAIQCSCPIVAHRLLTTGGDLRPVMLPLVAPPVALARYLRAISHPTRIRITYVGGCPGAVDEAIDIRMSPETLIGMLAERQIVLEAQPRVFESIIPPDRRRYVSQPGGVPSADRLWSDLGGRALVEVDSDDFVSEIAEHLLAAEHVLMDVAPRLGCVCSGAIPGRPPRESRAAVVALEPPRSTSPVIEEQTPLDLDMPIPAVPRAPVDAALAARSPGGSVALPAPTSSAANRPTVTEPRASRASQPTSRPIGGITPTRHIEGKPLPRTYVARRRHSTPRSHPAVPGSAQAERPPVGAEVPAAESTIAPEHVAPAEELTTPDVVVEATPSVVPAPDRLETTGEATGVEPAAEGLSRSSVEAPAGDATAPSTESTPELPAAASGTTMAAPPSVTDPGGSSQVNAEPLAPEADHHQLAFEALGVRTPPPPERLPIFAPTVSAERPVPDTSPRASSELKASRAAIYFVLLAVALIAVAGIAYIAGRSSHETPTTQQVP